jgi:hypothetical protein
MARRGYWGLAALLLMPAPAFALSPALSAALGAFVNAQIIASLVLVAVVSIWVPRFIKRALLAQQERADAAMFDRYAEATGLGAVSSPVSTVSDEVFTARMVAAGWEGHTGAVFDGTGADDDPNIKYRRDFASDDEYRDWFAEQRAANDASIHQDYFNSDAEMPKEWVDRSNELDHLSQLWNFESSIEEDPDPLDQPEALPSNHWSYAIT